MNGKINLCIVTNDNVFKIPFASIKNLDLFTVRYKDDKELVLNLIKILKLPIDIEEVEDVWIQYVHTDKKLPIKYMGDNYNTDSLIQSYIYYLQSDQKRLDGYGIRNVVRILEPDYRYKTFSNDYISMLARRYLKDDYRKIRDAYFLIKKYMIVKIDKVTPRKKSKEEDSLVFEHDDYIEYLINCLSRGEEEATRVLEELSIMDLEKLERVLKSYNLEIIDGIREEYDQCEMDDIHQLEKYTGINIDKLRYIVKTEDGRKKKR